MNRTISMRLRKMAEGFICGDFLPSFTLLLTVNMVYDILAKAKNLFIRFFIAIALLLHILAVGEYAEATSFIFLSPWKPGLISRKAQS